jgi:hypothetical protein
MDPQDLKYGYENKTKTSQNIKDKFLTVLLVFYFMGERLSDPFVLDFYHLFMTDIARQAQSESMELC